MASTVWFYTEQVIGTLLLSLVQRPNPVAASLWVSVNLHPRIYTWAKFHNYQQWICNVCDVSITKWKVVTSVWCGVQTCCSVNRDSTYFYVHALHVILLFACKAFIYSSAAADCCCCCSKAVYWPRPTLMLHPSNAAAAWPTFFACHTVATLPVSGRQAQRAAQGQAATGRLIHQQQQMQH